MLMVYKSIKYDVKTLDTRAKVNDQARACATYFDRVVCYNARCVL